MSRASETSKYLTCAETRQYQPIPTTFTPEFFKRYTDYVNNEDAVRSLIQGAISLVKKVIKKRGLNDLEVKRRNAFNPS